MNVIVKYIIHDKTNGDIYRLLDTDSGLMRETNVDFILKYLGSISNYDAGTNSFRDVNEITVNNINTFGGGTTTGVNDFETWCRMNNKLSLLEEYNTSRNPKPVSKIGKAAIDKVWWKCSKCGHEWETNIKNRTTVGAGCPMCRFKEGKYHTLVTGENDLETWCKNNGRIDLLSEYINGGNDIPPNKIGRGVSKVVNWKCGKCGRIYQKEVSHRTVNNIGCTNCSNSGTSIAELFIYNLLSNIFTDIRHRYKINRLEADIFIPSLNLVIDYRGGYWHSAPERQEKDDIKYNYFNNIGINQIIIYEVTTGQNSVDGLAITYNRTKPLSELANLLYKVFSNMNILIDISNYNLEIAERSANLMKNNREVPNNITITHPELVKRWDYERNGDLSPSSFTSGCKYKAWFKCEKCGQSYYSFIRKQADGQGCPVCSGNLCVTGYNDLATTHPEILLDWDYEKNNALGIRPTNVKAGSNYKVHWKCHNCGTESITSINSKTHTHGRQRHKCRVCGL